MKYAFICFLMLSVYRQTHAGAFQFKIMIDTISDIPAKGYIGYGNYCGIGGRGPVQDNIDSCCRDHDRCLERANRHECRFLKFAFYVVPYRWAMIDGRICCSMNNTKCGLTLCECDKRCAECLARNNHHYDPDLKKRNFLD